jgi:hypothetical protein
MSFEVEVRNRALNVAGNEKRRVLAKNTSTLKEKCDGNNSHLNQPIKNLHIIKKIIKVMQLINK